LTGTLLHQDCANSPRTLRNLFEFLARLPSTRTFDWNRAVASSGGNRIYDALFPAVEFWKTGQPLRN